MAAPEQILFQIWLSYIIVQAHTNNLTSALVSFNNCSLSVDLNFSNVFVMIRVPGELYRLTVDPGL